MNVENFNENNDDNAATTENMQGSSAENRRNKNVRNNKRTPKPRGPPPQPEYHYDILDKIVITKTSVQERLLRSKLLDENEISEPNEPKIEIKIENEGSPSETK